MPNTFQELQKTLSTVSRDIVRRSPSVLFFGGCIPSMGGVVKAMNDAMHIDGLSNYLSASSMAEEQKFKVLMGCCQYHWYQHEHFLTEITGDRLIATLKIKLELPSLQTMDDNEYIDNLKAFDEYVQTVLSDVTETEENEHLRNALPMDIRQQLSDQIAAREQPSESIYTKVTSAVGGVWQHLVS